MSTQPAEDPGPSTPTPDPAGPPLGPAVPEEVPYSYAKPLRIPWKWLLIVAGFLLAILVWAVIALRPAILYLIAPATSAQAPLHSSLPLHSKERLLDSVRTVDGTLTFSDADALYPSATFSLINQDNIPHTFIAEVRWYSAQIADVPAGNELPYVTASKAISPAITLEAEQSRIFTVTSADRFDTRPILSAAVLVECAPLTDCCYRRCVA